MTAAQRLGAGLRSRDESMLDQIPTEVTNHSKAPTDGVSSSYMLDGVEIVHLAHKALRFSNLRVPLPHPRRGQGPTVSGSQLWPGPHGSVRRS